MSVTARKDLVKETQKQLVNFSVRAQDYLVKQGLNKEDANRTMDEMFHNSLLGATTQASRDYDPSRYNSMTKSMHTGDEGFPGFVLPAINQGSKGSPFRGFKDISIVTQKIRKDMHSQDGTTAIKRNSFEFGSEAQQRRNDNSLVEGPAVQSGKTKATRFASKDRQVQMSSKVLENWIDETLQDAEHLDIPGVILTPENKLPITRYGIDRQTLTKANVDPNDVDRIYRALFVYSVGFYELIKKVMMHCDKKYTVITSIWKVFAILLEYCCRTDYRLLIQAISKEHKDELDRLEKEYQKKFAEQAANELVLKENQDSLQKYNEELDRERMNEKQLRMKLEEDYNQNTKNHEEEVQLRLKFESKLNNMHSAHRELESKYKRVLNDFTTAQKNMKVMSDKLASRNDEITALKTQQAENESQMLQDKETIASLQRELQIKNRQMRDMEIRTGKCQDELDLYRYKVQENQKDNTELKLKIDVSNSTIAGLSSEKSHLTLEVRELRDLNAIYEKKTKELMHDLQETTTQLQSNKREMIGFSEVNKERENKVAQLKQDLLSTKMSLEERDLQYGTISIKFKKTEDSLEQTRKEYDDVVEKLHKMNKARHDLETQLRDEIERNRSLQEVVALKEETLEKRNGDIDELDKKLLECERTKETIDIKRQGVERAFDMAKKQLNEKIQSLNEVITGEKETRDMWIERYEKETRERTATESQLLAARSDLKDQLLVVKNHEIKNSTLSRQIQILTEQNKKFQHEVNEAIAKAEGLDRELHTQKEILKQMELTKKEYIDKLKDELQMIEKRYLHLINSNSMLGEDYRSQGLENYHIVLKLREEIADLKDLVLQLQDTIKARDRLLTNSLEIQENNDMMREEDLTRYGFLNELKCQKEDEILQLKEEIQKCFDQIEEKKAELAAIAFQKTQRVEKNTMTIVGASYFSKDKSGGTFKKSGSINSPQMNSGYSNNQSSRQGSQANPLSRHKDAVRKPSNMDANKSQLDDNQSQRSTVTKNLNMQLNKSPSNSGVDRSIASKKLGPSGSKPSIQSGDTPKNKVDSRGSGNLDQKNNQFYQSTQQMKQESESLDQLNEGSGQQSSPNLRNNEVKRPLQSVSSNQSDPGVRPGNPNNVQEPGRNNTNIQTQQPQRNSEIQAEKTITSNNQTQSNNSGALINEQKSLSSQRDAVHQLSSIDPARETINEQTDESETIKATSKMTSQIGSGMRQQPRPSMQESNDARQQPRTTIQTDMQLRQSEESQKQRQQNMSEQQKHSDHYTGGEQSLNINQTPLMEIAQPIKRIAVDITNQQQSDQVLNEINDAAAREQQLILQQKRRQQEQMEDQTRQQEISHLQQQVQRQPKGPTNIRKLIMSANTRE